VPSRHGARRVTLESAQLAATLLCVVAILVAVASGVVSLLLGRAIHDHRDREIAGLLRDVHDRLLLMRPRAPEAALPRPQARPVLPAPKPAALPPPAAQLALAAPLPAPPTRGPRAIAPDQRDRMMRILALAPAQILITSDGTGEAEAFADQAAGVFRDAGWKVERSLFVSLNRPLPPLSADLGSEPQDVAIEAAFRAAGYPLTRRDPAASGQAREIFVGALPGSGQGAPGGAPPAAKPAPTPGRSG
jgi:hypothetical protein